MGLRLPALALQLFAQKMVASWSAPTVQFAGFFALVKVGHVFPLLDLPQ
ncbi:hypothetical protein [Ralstonia pseudosolanacearum]|nr:hypothetical protein [Ralstonia pseudosolanacearum]